MATLGFLFIFPYFLLINGLTSSYLTSTDKENFKSIFHAALLNGFTDVEKISLAVRGYALLDETIDNEKEACNLFKRTISSSNINDIYLSVQGSFSLKGEKCVLDVSNLKKSIFEVDRITTLENLFKATQLQSMLKFDLDGKTIQALTEKFLKKDSSAMNQAFSYYIMSSIFQNKTDLKKYFIDIEDTIQQADEVDGTYMFYEDGIYATSFIINSIFNLVDKYEEVPPIPMEKVIKFANFFYSRRHAHQILDAVELLSAMKSLSRNKFKVPIIISTLNTVVSIKDNSKVKIRATNLWGDHIGDLKIIADTVKNIQSAATVITRKACEPSTESKGIYELDLSTTQQQLSKGFYSTKFDVKANATQFNAGTSATVVLKIVSEVFVENVELTIKERDQIAGVTSYKLTMGKLLSDKLSMNWHHKLDMKFLIRDQNQQNIRPHQVFIKITHLITKQEIIFVAEPDRSDIYKFGLDLEKSNKDFDNLSGDYQMELVIGDSVISSPENWIFANIKLEMPSSPSAQGGVESKKTVAGTKRSAVNPRIGQGATIAKPQIFHMFKPAEKRGGQLISTVFTILSIVPPFVIMIILWSILGINISNFQFSLSPLMFHLGLITIFGLYYCYWSYLNMFITLKFLIPIGGVTAFFGNRVLRQIATKRKEV